MKRRWWLIGAAPALVALAVLALGRTGPTTAQPGPMGGHEQELARLSGDAFDRAFLQEMVMHHAMAVIMARPVAEQAQHQELRDLAAAIVADQTREIELMRGWLRDWYGVELPDMVAMMAGMHTPSGAMPMSGPHMGGMGQGMMPGGPGMPMVPQHGPMMGGGPGAMAHDQGTPMAGMHGMMAMMMDLGALPVPRMEAVFMSLMVLHHQDAVEMARLAAGRAAHEEVSDLAAGIITTQEEEIRRMNQWLRDWYGL
jgi:uncharacterized protein (DUF305 family)